MSGPGSVAAQASGADGGLPVTDTAAGWPVQSSQQLARGRLVALREDMVAMPDGSSVGREVIEHPGAVAVVAVDEAQRVLMIRQYRHPVARLLWEIPAGLRDVAGEPLVQTARRELLEETGYAAEHWQVLTDTFTSPGITTERVRVFLARGLTQVPAAEQSYVRMHEEALLETGWVPLEQAVSLLLAGELHNGVAATGILAACAAARNGYAGLRDTAAPED